MPLAQQLVQAVHAAIEAGCRFPLVGHPSLVLCEVRSESALLRAAAELSSAGIGYALFREPDLKHQATALATEP
ncbi:MAG: hypothetical protein AAF657_38010, partial [Acidobacteriota bacterium]